MDIFDIIGYIGTCLLGITLVPQVHKTFKRKKASDLSLSYLVLQILSNILFIIYGYGIQSIPVIASNCMVVTCSLTLVYAKFRFGSDSEYTLVQG
jgi:MtN3 and saliva related transmembrane protein